MRVKIDKDEFSKVTTFIGPKIELGYDYINMRARRNRDNGKLSYQIYIKDNYSGDWRFYDTAYDLNGTRLKLVNIHKEIKYCSNDYCSLNEHIGLNVHREYLEKSIENGIEVKIYGQTGYAVFKLPGGYIEGFLDVVDIW
jgi:hypothetical protein